MGSSIGVGYSALRNPVEAGKDATERALRNANIEKADFVLMFATVGYDQRMLLDSVREATGGAPLAGCSGEGVIAREIANETNFGVTVMVVSSDEMAFVPAMARGVKGDSEGVGRKIAQALAPHVGSDAAALIVLAEGLTVNFDRLLRGLTEHLAPGRFLPIVGGLSGDNFEFSKTYQYCNDELADDGAVGILVRGAVNVATVINNGCVPIGAERKITRCDGNVIFEIDEKPALSVLKEYLSGEVENWQKEVMLLLSIAFKAPPHLRSAYDEYVIRYIPGKDDATGAITIPVEVNVGDSVWMSRRDKQKITDGIDTLIAHMKEQIGDHTPKLMFQFDCGGRGKYIFREQEQLALLAKMQSGIEGGFPWLGLYTYGEIGPAGRWNAFHNYTVVLVALY